MAYFDDLSSQISDAKDDWKWSEILRLEDNVSNLERRIISSERNRDLLKQYRRWKNVEITAVLDTVLQKARKCKFVQVLSTIRVEVSVNNADSYHRMDKSQNNSNKLSSGLLVEVILIV